MTYLAHPLMHGKLKLIIASSPNNTNGFISIIQKYKVSDLIRACDKQYDDTTIKLFCTVHECVFEDGTAPSMKLVDEVIELMCDRFYSCTTYEDRSVLIHCAAGLGRAPVLACVAIIVCENMEPLDAISLVREHVRGAFNKYQLNYLMQTNWKPQQKKFKSQLKNRKSKEDHCACIIC